MAINFPTSPSNGDTVTEGNITYTYNATKGYWVSVEASGGGSSVTVSDTAPASPSDGDMWYNSLDLNLYVYYNDGTSSQWVQSAPQQAGVAGADSTVAGPAGPAGGDGRAGVYADMAALIAKTGMVAGDQALVTALNKVFMYTGTAWYLVATMTNDSPTTITGVDGTYTLATDGTSTTITAVSTDPEGFALTWSYAVTTGSLGSTATVSQADNVFTITPSTTEADAGTFSITFSVTDGATGAVSAVSAFTLAFIVTNSRYTALSVKATATGSNQTFDDASTSNHTITASGDVTASTFSPHRHGGYSAYFDGTGDYLTFPHSTSTAEWWNDDFTIEAWVYYTSFTESSEGRPHVLKHGAVGSTTDYWSFGAISNGTLLFYYWNGGAIATCVSTSTLSLNTWHHITMCHDDSDNEINLYLDGVNVKTHTVSGTPQSSASSTMIIGNNTSSYFTGYMSNLRVIKGTEVYTSNFTPPTAPLTAITNTKFLLGNLPYFKDQSTSNHAITPNGNVSLRPKSVFDNTPYSEASHGASAYFDGTGDRINLNGDAEFAFGTNDFTVEFWLYPVTRTATEGILIDFRGSSADGTYTHLYLDNQYSNNVIIYHHQGGTRITSSPILDNAWSHVALTRSGNDVKLFVNGIQEGSTFTNSLTQLVGTNGPQIGSYHTGAFALTGYMSDIRILNGTAAYTSNFTPPTAPLTAVTNTKFLLNPETSISDLSQKSEIQCFGDAATSTTQVKFAGTKSIYLDGTGDYVQINNIADSWISEYAGDFTVEFWWYPTNVSVGTFQEIFTAGAGFQLYIFNGGGLSLALSSNNTGSYFLNAQEIHTMVNDTWQHLAVVRNGNVYTIYVDGVSKSTTTTSTSLSSGTDPIQLGILGGTTYPTVGYFQDIRVTKGLARYTANFTPPTEELGG